jgi:hypothetical protein
MRFVAGVFSRRSTKNFVDLARELGKVTGAEPRAFHTVTFWIPARRFGDWASDTSCGEGFRMAGTTITRSGLQRWGRRFAKRAWPLSVAAVAIGAGLLVGNVFRSAPPCKKRNRS